MKMSPMRYFCECGAPMLIVAGTNESVLVRCLAVNCLRRGERRCVKLQDAEELLTPVEDKHAA